MIPLVMISPFGDALWAAQRRHFRAGPAVDVFMSDQADTLEAVVERVLANAPPRFAIAGHCIGGYVALAAARRAPGRVAGLALFNSSARADNPAEAALRAGRIARLEGAASRQDHDAARYIAEALSWMISPHGARQTRIRRAAEAALGTLTPRASLRLQRAIARREDLRAALATIDAPTLAVAGADDRIVSPAYALDFAAVPECVPQVVPACGHLSPIEIPEQVNALLDAWLDACGAAASGRPHETLDLGRELRERRRVEDDGRIQHHAEGFLDLQRHDGQHDGITPQLEKAVRGAQTLQLEHFGPDPADTGLNFVRTQQFHEHAPQARKTPNGPPSDAPPSRPLDRHTDEPVELV